MKEFYDNLTLRSALGLVFYFATFLVLSSFVFIFFALVLKYDITDASVFSDATLGALTNFTIYFGLTLVFAILFLKEVREEFIEFIGDLKENGKKILMGFGVFYLFQVIIMLYVIIFSVGGESVNQESIETIMSSSLAILMILATVLFAPIVEEFIYRKAFFTLINNKIVALIVSSIAFGAIHVLGAGDFMYAPIYILMGVSLGLAYLLGDENIYIPIIIHAANNLVSTIQVFGL